jgi:copper ion binding protein
MMCQNSCASTVAAAIKAVQGVTAVAVSFAVTRAIVSGSFDAAAVIEAVEDVGFDIAPAATATGSSASTAAASKDDLEAALRAALEAGGPGVLGPRGDAATHKKQSAKPSKATHAAKASMATTTTAAAAKARRSKSSINSSGRSRSRSRNIEFVDGMWVCDYVVSGIVCAACAARIEGVVKALDGVTVARVGVITEKLHVCFDASRQSQSVVEAAVEALGYRLTLVRSVAVGMDGAHRSGGGSDGSGGTVVETPVTQHVLLVTGMTCANCASKVERTLGALSGVARVAVSVTENRVVVQMAPDSAEQPAGIRTILESVQGLGFGVRLGVGAA